jgi:hypothetical protein
VRAALGGLCLFLLIASHAAAQETRDHRSVNVSTNREGRVGYYASPDEACGKGIPPEISIAEQPNYGKIVFRADRLLAYTANVPPRAFGCRGQFVDATTVFYKPAPHYHGSDRVVLRVYFPAAANGPASILYDTIYITVR